MAAREFRTLGAEECGRRVREMIESFPGFKVQYIEFVNADTLQPVDRANGNTPLRACIAVLTSTTRLIDNIAL